MTLNMTVTKNKTVYEGPEMAIVEMIGIERLMASSVWDDGVIDDEENPIN